MTRTQYLNLSKDAAEFPGHCMLLEALAEYKFNLLCPRVNAFIICITSSKNSIKYMDLIFR